MLDTLLARNLVPDFAVRAGIRQLLKKRLRDENNTNNISAFVEEMKRSPIAIQTRSANEQHYEVPARFFELVLGKRMKYSSALWQDGVSNLDQAEEDMLRLTCDRAELSNGMRILELGCGWGSLSTFMAETLRDARITAVSNSRTQKDFIDARERANLRIITADMNSFETESGFDRIVSVEMFEHMRNYEKLLEKCARFLKSNGKLFIHIFVHREFAYPFVPDDASDWMGRYFFTGGMMPSDRLLYEFPAHFEVEKHWKVSGVHYRKTAEAWLQNMQHHKQEIMDLFDDFYGEHQAARWWSYWRIFFMACAELWGYGNGDEWFVGHYLLKKRS